MLITVKLNYPSLKESKKFLAVNRVSLGGTDCHDHCIS